MSAQEPLSEKSSPVAAGPPPQVAPPPAARSARSRSLILVAILALMLGALWYDYKVARPGVETAFATVEKLNSDINARPGKSYVTEKLVQQALNRTPKTSFVEGPYRVEVYSWRAGLPIRSHNYYAVYSEGTPLIFMKHYKFELPIEELQLAANRGDGDGHSGPLPPQAVNGMSPGMPTPMPMAPSGGGLRVREITPRAPVASDAGTSEAPAASGDGDSAPAATAGGDSAPTSETPAAAATPTEPAAEQPAGDAAPASSAPPADAAPAKSDS